MLPLRRLLLMSALSCLALGASAAEPTWRFCHEDNETYPWILKEREGLYAALARIAAKRADARIELVELPWKRCLTDVKSGAMDGVIGAGFLVERCEIGVYPGEECRADLNQRLYIDRFPLYRNRNSALQWDGKKLLGQTKPIAVQPGFVAARVLKQMGVPIDETDKQPYQILRKVAAGMVDGAILQAPVADPLLREITDFGNAIERMPVSFQEYPTFLVLSHQRFNADPKRARAIWQAFVQTRDSAEYQAAKAALGYSEPD
ncbi:substrate-binding periplasmic protein [Chitinimonas koreensis]|uniref:substrate-binding periplasmic protein n=1 Tax=Chitinimonas koreensis TaxID=356302 RepID=UPI0003FDF7F6|nr:transporter substrate-binding domain-containing protein [Chitinimonas koreensis]QNM97943.1 transporter substrate-binding domain-containing protein [Chitinimonas koreensis]